LYLHALLDLYDLDAPFGRLTTHILSRGPLRMGITTPSNTFLHRPDRAREALGQAAPQSLFGDELALFGADSSAKLRID
jgi:hypothetical protein